MIYPGSETYEKITAELSDVGSWQQVLKITLKYGFKMQKMENQHLDNSYFRFNSAVGCKEYMGYGGGNVSMHTENP